MCCVIEIPDGYHAIDTVPRDGRLVEVGEEDNGTFVMRWVGKEWQTQDKEFIWSDGHGFGPTYWRPLRHGEGMAQQ